MLWPKHSIQPPRKGLFNSLTCSTGWDPGRWKYSCCCKSPHFLQPSDTSLRSCGVLKTCAGPQSLPKVEWTSDACRTILWPHWQTVLWGTRTCGGEKMLQGLFNGKGYFINHWHWIILYGWEKIISFQCNNIDSNNRIAFMLRQNMRNRNWVCTEGSYFAMIPAPPVPVGWASSALKRSPALLSMSTWQFSPFGAPDTIYSPLNRTKGAAETHKQKNPHTLKAYFYLRHS